ncbi:dihydrofolate reductase [Aeromonas phage CF8]|nr:dihydrofolate reductase [Aeromonas phage CF8]
MTQPIISAIFAIDCYGGMGYENKLPWSPIKEDFAWFKQHTMNKVVVMGYKTWDSLPVRPLMNRTNVVLSNRIDTIEGAVVCKSFADVIAKYPNEKEIVIIGGAETIRTLRDHISRVYVTTVNTVNLADLLVEGNWEEWDLRYHDEFTSERCTFDIWEMIDDSPSLAFYTKGGLKPERKELMAKQD